MGDSCLELIQSKIVKYLLATFSHVFFLGTIIRINLLNLSFEEKTKCKETGRGTKEQGK